MVATLREQQISLVHTRRPLEALETYLLQPNRDLQTDSFCLRTIARCIRATGEVLDDQRYVQLQRNVLDNIDSLDTRGVSNVIFWMRINIHWRRRSDVPIEPYKLPLTRRLEALISKEALANRQLVTLLLDLMYLNVKNTIFVESKLIDRLKNPHELFLYTDFRQILAFMANRKLKNSRNLFEFTAFRVMKGNFSDIDTDIECFKYTRNLMLSYNWDKITELWAFLRENILKHGQKLSIKQINRITYPFGENPNSPFGLEDLLNSVYETKIAENGLNALDYAILLDYLKRLDVISPWKLPVSLRKAALSYFETLKMSDLASAYAPILLGIAHFEVKLPIKVKEKLPKTESVVTKLAIMRVFGENEGWEWVQEAGKLNGVELLQAVAESRGEGTGKLLGVLEEWKAGERKHQLYAGVVSGLWKGSFRWKDIRPACVLLLSWLETALSGIDTRLLLSFLRTCLPHEPSKVASLLSSPQVSLTPEAVEGWLRTTEVIGDFESYVSLLSLLPAAQVSLHSLLTLLRFHTPPSSLTHYAHLLSRNTHPILSDPAFHHHIDTILNLMRLLPGHLQPFISRLVREIKELKDEFLCDERVLKTLVVLREIEEQVEAVPVISLDRLGKHATAVSKPYLSLLFPGHSDSLFRVPNQSQLLPRTYSTSQLHHKLSGFAHLSSSSAYLYNLCTAVQDKASDSPLATFFPLIQSLAEAEHEKLTDMVEKCTQKMINRVKNVDYQAPDLWLQALSTLRFLPTSTHNSDISWLISRLEGAFEVLSPYEKVQTCKIMGEIGYFDSKMWELTAENIISEGKLVKNLGADMIYSLHLAQKLHILPAKSLLTDYIRLNPSIDPINYSKIALAYANFPQYRDFMKNLYAKSEANLPILQRYLISLEYKLPEIEKNARFSRLPGLLSQNFPVSFQNILTKLRISYTLSSVKSGILHPCVFPRCNSVLWLPRAALYCVYSQCAVTSTTSYQQALKNTGSRLLLARKSDLDSEEKTQNWLRQHSIV